MNLIVGFVSFFLLFEAFEPPLEESSESAINSLLLNQALAPPPPVLVGAAADVFLDQNGLKFLKSESK